MQSRRVGRCALEHALHRFQLEVAARAGSPTLDLLPALRRADGGVWFAVQGDWIHANTEGHHQFASAVEGWLRGPETPLAEPVGTEPSLRSGPIG